MPSAASLTPPTTLLPDSPPPKKMPRFTDIQYEQDFDRCPRGLDLLSRPAPPSIRLQDQSPVDSDPDVNSIVPQSGEAEDDYTISAYGDISLSEVVVPSLLPRPSPDVLHSTNSHLRLKVKRPPMPKRRPSYNYIADPLGRNESLDLDKRWPGSPRPIKNNRPWLRHQPLVSPLSDDSSFPRAEGNKAGASLERLVNELLPRSPSIRLSPPGSPNNQAISLPQEEHETPAKQPRSKPVPTSTPAPLQEKPWRTKLPARPPIPKWDM